MSNRLHEGMTRTQSPPKDGPPLRLAALFLVSALLLVCGWAIFSSMQGTGEQRAQAQASGAEGDSAGASGDGEDEISYEAFGEYKNPFDRSRVAQLQMEDTQQSGDDPVNEVEDQDRSTSNDDNDPPSGNGDDDAQQRTSSSTPPANGGAAGGSGAEDVNCQNPEDEFEELLCEEGAPGSGGDEGSAQPGGSAGAEDDRDGGSGRSGAGEPTQTFRNGGPAPGK